VCITVGISIGLCILKDKRRGPCIKVSRYTWMCISTNKRRDFERKTLYIHCVFSSTRCYK